MAASSWAPQAKNFPSSRAPPILSASQGSDPRDLPGRAARPAPLPAAAALSHQSGMHFQFLRHPSPSSAVPSPLLPILSPPGPTHHFLTRAQCSGHATGPEDGGWVRDSPGLPVTPEARAGRRRRLPSLEERFLQGPAPTPSGPAGSAGSQHPPQPGPSKGQAGPRPSSPPPGHLKYSLLTGLWLLEAAEQGLMLP